MHTAKTDTYCKTDAYCQDLYIPVGLLQMNFSEFEVAMTQLAECVKKHSTNTRFKSMGKPGASTATCLLTAC